MTNDQAPPAVQQNNNPENVDATIVDPVTPITKLLRFLYTGSTTASIPVKSSTAPNLQDIATTLAFVIDMATALPNLPIATIRKAYDTKMYVRVDEIFIALAFCARQTHCEQLRTLANSEALLMIANQADFLLFVHYYVKLSEILRGAGHKHFGHGMCRVVEKWYEKHSPIDLANMFGEHRGLHGLTHQSVIKKAHMRTKKRINANAGASASASVAGSGDAATASTAAAADEGAAATPSRKKPRMTSNSNTEVNANDEGAAATVASTSNAQPATTSSAADEGALSLAAQNAAANDTNTATSAATTSSPLSPDDDREQVFQFVFSNGGQEYLKYLEEKPELGAAAERLKALQQLKTNENVDSAVKAIQRHKFTIDQMPAHLLEQQKIWDVLLPTLSTKSLLHHFHTMKDHGFFNEDTAFTRKFLNLFGKPETLKSENICPINVYLQKVLYSKNMRYLCEKKAEYYKKKMEKRKVTTNPSILKRLDELFDQTLRNAKPMPAKFFIVMDLRRGNAKKPILKNKHVTCFDAAFLLAYSIYVRERDTLVYSFTDTKDKLQPLNPIMSKNNYKMAREAVDHQMVAKTYQSLVKPIAEATAAKKKVDVFVVVVDSVARFCRQGQVPVQEFQEYRRKFNERAKFVVINMTRPKPDLKIPATDAMKGFFEICGFNQDTPKILNALAKHCFT